MLKKRNAKKVTKVSAEEAFNLIRKKFNGRVVEPWDDKKGMMEIGPTRVCVAATKRSIHQNAEVIIVAKNAAAILERDVFDIPTLRDADLIDINTPKLSVPKGTYRLKRKPLIIYPTGILPVDMALGVGGLAGGKAHRFWGPSQSSKSYLLYILMIYTYYAFGKKSLIVDAEDAFEEQRFFNLPGAEQMYEAGALEIFEPGAGDEAFDETLARAGSGEFGIVGYDSITASVSKGELERSLQKDPRLGDKARMQTRFLEALMPNLRRTSTAVIMIVQPRRKTSQTYGTHDPIAGTYSRGGEAKQGAADAVEFYTQQSIQFDAPSGVVWSETGGMKEMIAHSVSGIVDKNRLAPRGRKFKFQLSYYEGADSVSPIIEEGVKSQLIEMDGRKLIFPEGREFKNVKEAKASLQEDRQFYMSIYQMMIERTSVAARRGK